MTRVGQILRACVKPVMGCTEPAAVALASAFARGAAQGAVTACACGGAAPPAAAREAAARRRPWKLELLRVRVTRSIFKNAMAVGIPPAGGESGIHIAAAMGLFLPPGEGLGLLKAADAAAVARARQVVRDGRLVLEMDERDEEIHIEAMVIGTFGRERHVGEAVIAGAHDRVALLRRDGRTLYRRAAAAGGGERPSPAESLSSLTMGQLIALAGSIGKEDEAFLLEGVRMNREAAARGLELKLGLGVGAALRGLVEAGRLGDDLAARVRIATAAAADARMSGYEIEVMASSGSGNQGIMAVLPVAVAADELGAGAHAAARALALSHLLTAKMTLDIGLLTSLCGCVVKAGIGAAAGIALLIAGREEAVEAAVCNMAGNIVGEICDGAKVGCALKLATAAGAAAESALLAGHGVRVPPSNGIVGEDAARTFDNICAVSASMKGVDRAIVGIIQGKRAAPREQ